MRSRPGFMLLEALVAASLAAVVMSLAVVLLQLQSRIAQNATERSERNDASRTALATLHAELRALAPQLDVRAVGRDSIATRIFRGLAVVCAHDAQRTYARYRGLRLPDAGKDSALEPGIENVSAIFAVATDSAACAHASDEQVVALVWNARAPPGSMWLIFETGAYHLGAHALRYRRGDESRQPITNEVFNDTRSGFALVSDSALRALSVTLTHRKAGASASTRIRFLNRQ